MLIREACLAVALLGLGCSPDAVRSSGDDTSSTSATGSSGVPEPEATTTTASSDGGTSSSGSASDSSSEDGGTTEGRWPPPDPGPVCGDGNVDPGEECDDGNTDKADRCNDDCVLSEAILWDTFLPPEGEGACAEAVAVSNDGAIVVGGTTRMGEEFVNAWLGVLDEHGALQWSQSWDGGGNERDEVMGVDTDADGNIYAFTTQQMTFRRGWLSKRDPSGLELWSEQLLTEAGEHSHALAIAVDADGTATVLGRHNGDYEGHRLQRFDTDGVAVWPEVVDIENAVPIMDASLDLDPLGGVRVALTMDTEMGRRATLQRFDTNGALSWSVQSNPPPGEDSQGATTVEGASALILQDQFDSQLVVRSWDADGANPAAFAPGFDADVTLTDAAFGPSGNLYVVGREQDATWALRIDPSGALAWARRNSEVSHANAVAVAPDGDVIVVGCTQSTDGAIWVRRYAP